MKIVVSAKYVIEFVVIVVGVFIAVAAESWWSDRQERAFERELRTDMLSEFDANIRILEQDIELNEASTEYFERLPRLSDSQLLGLSDETLDREYRRYPSWEGFDPEMGLAQALVGSGNLNSISDRELRLRLSRWAGLLVEKDRKNLQAVNFQMLALMPAIAIVSNDGQWTAEERRQIQTLYSTMAQLRNLVLVNQTQLLDEARSIYAYLAEPE
jgi:hypothetical protein